MAEGTIQDHQITASSVKRHKSRSASNARLNYTGDIYNSGAWCPQITTNSWIQVNLTVSRLVIGVVTQGRSDVEEWVIRFEMKYSEDGSNWYYIHPDKPGETNVSKWSFFEL